MHVTLLTPAGAAIALVALVPLAAVVLTELRARRVRRELGLVRPRRVHLLLLAAAVALTGLLVGAAAAQPVLERGETLEDRLDANAYVIVDSTRSMLAAATPRSANRMARARELALELRTAVPELKVGIASMTDRILPHVFPTLNDEVFASTLEHSIGIERPPPGRRAVTATDLRSLAQLGPQSFFPATPERRIVVVLSDFETEPFPIATLATQLRRQRIQLILVHVWDAGERIFGGAADAGYRPDPRSLRTVEQLAGAAGGAAFGEDEVEGAKAALRRALGAGPTRPRWEESSRTELAPWLALASLVPVGFVLWRRNLP